MGMSTAELEAFARRDLFPPRLASLRLPPDGTTHRSGVVSVGHRRRDDLDHQTRAWVRNLLRDPRVAFSVQTFEEPYPAVMMRGGATVATANDAATAEEIRAITAAISSPRMSRGTLPAGRTCAPSSRSSRLTSCPGRARLKSYGPWLWPAWRGRCRTPPHPGDPLLAKIARRAALTWPPTGDCRRGVSVSDRGSPLITARSGTPRARSCRLSGSGFTGHRHFSRCAMPDQERRDHRPGDDGSHPAYIPRAQLDLSIRRSGHIVRHRP